MCLVFETAVFSAWVLILLCIFNSLNQLTNRDNITRVKRIVVTTLYYAREKYSRIIIIIIIITTIRPL